MLEEYKKKLQVAYSKIRDLKEQGRQNEREYHVAFQDMAKNYEIVKDLEKQKNQIGDAIVEEQILV